MGRRALNAPPRALSQGGLALLLQGLPFAINGVGDLLALFRCISCKYKFSTDVTKHSSMGAGAPGGPAWLPLACCWWDWPGP